MAEGAIRAGKTAPMSFSFVCWAMRYFDQQNFLLCGKTIGSLRRNVVQPLKKMLLGRGMEVIEHRADNYIEVRYLNHVNCFYLFGGKDESSQDLVQGITAAGAYFDEVALQPESFVNQAIGRCSITGAKLWFNCNPESPFHWFYEKWIQKAKEKGLMVLHFLMDDNPSLDETTKNRYKQMYAPGTIFFKRFILGLWCVAEGAVYSFFTDDPKHGYVVDDLPSDLSRWIVAADYGQQHPTCYGLFGFSTSKKCWYMVKEWYTANKPNTEFSKEFGREMLSFGGKKIVPEYVDIDPGGGGLSLIEQLRADYPDLDRAGVIGHAIKVEVVKEIQDLSTALYTHSLRIYRQCKRVISEIMNYLWDSKARERGVDAPIKKDDDGPDMLRYFWQRAIRA